MPENKSNNERIYPLTARPGCERGAAAAEDSAVVSHGGEDQTRWGWRRGRSSCLGGSGACPAPHGLRRSLVRQTQGCCRLLAASAASGWCDRETLRTAARAVPLLRRFGACVLLGARRGGGEGKGKLCTPRMLSAGIARQLCSGVSNGFPKHSSNLGFLRADNLFLVGNTISFFPVT